MIWRLLDEDGSVSVAGAIFALGILTLVGLVVYQGESLGSLSRTREMADNAARAAAQEVDVDHLLGTGELRIDPTSAEAAARAFVNSRPSMSVTDVTVAGTTVTVTVSETVEPSLGVGVSRTFSATESASVLRGVSEVIE